MCVDSVHSAIVVRIQESVMKSFLSSGSLHLSLSGTEDLSFCTRDVFISILERIDGRTQINMYAV